jgi:iron(III) transport system permease protein
LPAVFLSGTLLAIGFAYIVRFLAVSFQPLHAGMDRICGSLDEASRVLGKPPLATLWRVNLPLLRGTILAALMLVFVDILKELPLTLILRPANFETLATIAFGMASEGRIQESALPSLMIILLGAAGLILLNRFMREPTK